MAEKLTKHWYIVNTYASHENKVKLNIERRIETMGMQDYIFQVVVVEQEVPVLKDGVPTGKYKMKNMFPGYLYIEMIMTDEAWYVVRNTPGVTGFIGSSGKGAKPFPVSEEEMESVLKRAGLHENASVGNYNVGDWIRVINGPLSTNDSPVQIKAVDNEKGLISFESIMLGRVQTFDISVNDVEKVK